MQGLTQERISIVWSHARVQAASEEKDKNPAGWSCCYNICVLLDNQRTCFLQHLVFLRGTSRCTCENELSLSGKPHKIFVRNHWHSHCFSWSWTDQSSHKMCDTGKSSNSISLYLEKHFPMQQHSEVPRPAGVHGVFDHTFFSMVILHCVMGELHYEAFPPQEISLHE